MSPVSLVFLELFGVKYHVVWGVITTQVIFDSELSNSGLTIRAIFERVWTGLMFLLVVPKKETHIES